MMHSLVRWGLLLTLCIVASSWWMAEALPDARELHPALLQEPQQQVLQASEYSTQVDDIEYRVQPRFRYELHGLIVSRHDAAVWWDYAHEQWGDYLNVADLCVVWGANVQTGAYRGLDFHNDQWTCWAQADSAETWAQFDMHALGNNHVLTDQPDMARRLRQLRIGDQIRLQGYLADYSVVRNGQRSGPRISSSVRTDTGNGACEVLFVEQLQVLRHGNAVWRALFWPALILLGLLLVIWYRLPFQRG